MGGDGGWVTEGKNKGNQGIRVNQTRIKNNEEELRKEKRKEGGRYWRMQEESREKFYNTERGLAACINTTCITIQKKH